MKPTMMTVAVCYGKNDIRFERVPLRELSPNEVLIRIAYCGICPSDLRIYDGRSPQEQPIILGHEFSGWIEEVGPAVTNLKPGDPVVVNPSQPCEGECAACRRGITNKCLQTHAGGGGDGLAEYNIAKASRVYSLSSSADLLPAALCEPLACVLHGQRRAKVRPGSVVLVVGSGPIGQLHLLCAKSAGAKVIMSEVQSSRAAVAARLGADVVVDPTRQDLAKVVRTETGGWGVDAAIVAVGDKGAIESAVGLLGMQGTLILFAGMYPVAPIVLDPNLIHYSEINITGSSDYTDPEFFEAVNFILNGTVDPRKTISDIIPFERTREGFDMVKAGDRSKVVVQINQA